MDEMLYLRESLFEDGIPLPLRADVGSPPAPRVDGERVRRQVELDGAVDGESQERGAHRREEEHPAAAVSLSLQ